MKILLCLFVLFLNGYVALAQEKVDVKASSETDRLAEQKLRKFSTNNTTMAVKLASLLNDKRQVIGSLETSGNEVILKDLNLRLIISERFDHDGQSNYKHFHVFAQSSQYFPEKLDACIIGVGDDDKEMIADAAEIYSDLVLPSILSFIKGEEVLTASQFYGTESWGVAGYRGFKGNYAIRGASDDSQFDEATFFADIPNLPSDKRAHLLKATLQCQKGAWIRNIEIDGETPLVIDQKWNQLPASPSPIIIIQFAIIHKKDAISDLDIRESALDKLKKHPSWLFPAEACPFEVMPKQLSRTGFSSHACKEGRLQDCIIECRKGSASACYNAALEIQRNRGDKSIFQALFLRACRLGHASGCTNATAGRKDNDACSLRSFEKICEIAQDPWACTMYGGLLFRDSQKRNTAKIREALRHSCRHGPEDPACAYAMKILEQLNSE